MDNLFLLLSFVSIIILIVGLIKPNVFTYFLKKRATRKGVLMIFGISTVVFFVLFGIATDKSIKLVENKNEVPIQQTQQKADEDHYSIIKVSNVTADNNKVNISGNTNLPTGATLIVGFNVWGRTNSDLDVEVNKKTTVSNGKFSASLNVPQRKEFKKGPYNVSVSFTPRGQSDSVITFIGKDGENLKGNLVDKTFGFNTLELEKKVDIQLSIIVPSYIFQTSSKFPQGSAERTLANYITGWKNQDWQKMVNSSQKTWVSGESDPASTLKAWYGFMTLKGFKIKDTKTISDTTKDITFVVYYEAITNQIDKRQITARVIKETAPYTPSTQGQWGVNPISAD